VRNVTNEREVAGVTNRFGLLAVTGPFIVVLVLVSNAFAVTSPTESARFAATKQIPPRAVSTAPLLHPHHLALTPKGDTLVVADVGNDQLRLLDPESLEMVGEFGAGLVGAPHDLVFDAKGVMLVVDTHQDRIVGFSCSGVHCEFSGVVQRDLGFPESAALSVAGSDERLLVSGTGRARLTLLGRAAGKADWRQLRQLRHVEGKPLRQPHGVRALSDGRWLLADSGNSRLVLLDSALVVLKVFRAEHLGMRTPKAIAVDVGTRRIFVTNEDPGAVHVFDFVFGSLGVVGSGYLTRPEGVAARGDTLWVADTFNNRVLRFRLPESMRGTAAVSPVRSSLVPVTPR
jgi:DNA-binding beta-propeller fold protein YncE